MTTPKYFAVSVIFIGQFFIDNLMTMGSIGEFSLGDTIIAVDLEGLIVNLLEFTIYESYPNSRSLWQLWLVNQASFCA